jgi:flagellar protein FlbT
MALRLRLKPRERLIVGGALLRNGSTRSQLMIENQVPVLRGCDILSPRAVRTPCGRIYMALQLLYVDPDGVEQHRRTYRKLVADVLAAAPSCGRWIKTVDAHVSAGRIYQAIRSARPLLAHEQELLRHVQ